ncbi:hypothetical protein QTP88_010230 [Uroleucon formosanum]
MDTSKLVAFLNTYAHPNEDLVFDEVRLTNFLEQACDSCMPKKKYDGRPQEASKALRVAIRRSQESSWNELCRQVDNDPWDLPYKIVTKKLIGRRRIPGITSPGRLDKIIEHLFPRCTPPDYNAITTMEQGIPLFSLDELLAAGRNFPNGKAPGHDGVPDEVLRVIIKIRPELLLPTFNGCIKNCRLFNSWKTATLVLLRKGMKPLEETSSYRSLCLINSIGKLYE